jgi:hypothetical protein
LHQPSWRASSTTPSLFPLDAMQQVSFPDINKYFHIDIAEVQTEDGKLYMFVAVDRTSSRHTYHRQRLSR